MKKILFKEIEIPEGVEVKIDGSVIIVNGKEGKNKREFNLNGLELKKEGNKIILGSKKATKKEKKRINTTIAHINNMVKGVQEKFRYELKICFSHFPFTLDIKNDEVLVKNFLGEKIPRKKKISKGVDIKIDKQKIIVESVSKELAGQAAADLERVTLVRGRDRRIFQDGIFMINKAGREL